MARIAHLTSAAVAGVLVWPAAAGAETYCVPAHAGCSGTTQATVSAAFSAAAANNNAPTVDRVQIGPGTFTGTPNFTYIDAEPIEIVGAGTGQTTLTGPVQAGAFIVLGTGTGTNTTVSDLTVAIPGGNTTNGGIRAGGTVERVNVTGDANVTAGPGIEFQSTGGVLRQSIVSMPTASGTSRGVGFFGNNTAATIEDVTITARKGMSLTGGYTGVSATVHRADVSGYTSAIQVDNGTTLTIDDSVLRVPAAGDGILVVTPSVDNTATTLNADHLTIVGNGSSDGLEISASPATAGDVNATLTSSIVRNVSRSWVRGGPGAGDLNLTITHSNYNQGSASNGANPGNLIQAPGNIDQDPLFAGAADLHLTAGSPSIDTGTTIPAGGSSTDLDGKSRTQDGNGDGNAITDMGAYEFPSVLPAGGGPSGGGPVGGGPGVLVDRTLPLATLLRSSRFAFPAAGTGPTVTARTTGTRISYRLSEPAQVKFTVQSERPGRRVGRLCRVRTRLNRLRPRCRRYVPRSGSFSHSGRKGSNSFRFTGRLAGRKLPPGFYRLTGVPVDAAGNRGVARTVRFKIVP